MGLDIIRNSKSPNGYYLAKQWKHHSVVTRINKILMTSLSISQASSGQKSPFKTLGIY